MLSHQKHDDCMRELQQEVYRCVSRAALQGTPDLTEPSRGMRHPCGCSASWAYFPSEEPQGREVTNMAKKRLSNGMVWITKVTFPIEELKQIRMAPKSLTRMPRTIPVTLQYSLKIKSYRQANLFPYERLGTTVKILGVQKQGMKNKGSHPS